MVSLILEQAKDKKKKEHVKKFCMFYPVADKVDVNKEAVRVVD
jgi:hypothetical protein